MNVQWRQKAARRRNGVWTVSEEGFTLLEVMIVAIIVGILAIIAFPNFVKYQAKTRQAEAKSNLSGIFIAQTSYFAEETTYGNFSQLGFTTAGRTNRYTYRSGAADPGGGASSGTANIDVINPAPGYPITPENTVVPAANSAAGAAVPSFTATATSNLDTDLVIDEWHINELKQNILTADITDVDL